MLKISKIPRWASISLPLLSKVNLGDSGQKGMVTSWKIDGTMVIPNKIGQRVGVPRMDSMPIICETRIEMVTTS